MYRATGGPTQCPNCGAPWEPTPHGACRFCEHLPVAVGGSPAAPPTVPTFPATGSGTMPMSMPASTSAGRSGCGLLTAVVLLLVILPIVGVAVAVFLSARSATDTLNRSVSTFTVPKVSVPGSLNGTGQVSGALTGNLTGVVSATGSNPLQCRSSVGEVSGLIFSGPAPAPPGGDLSIIANLPAGLKGPGTYGLDQSLRVDAALTGPSTRTWTAGAGTVATLTVSPDGSVTLRFEGLQPGLAAPGGDPLLAQPLSGTVTLTCGG